MSIADEILKLFDNSRELTRHTIYQSIDRKQSSIRQALYRLSKSKKLVQNGIYFNLSDDEQTKKDLKNNVKNFPILCLEVHGITAIYKQDKDIFSKVKFLDWSHHQNEKMNFYSRVFNYLKQKITIHVYSNNTITVYCKNSKHPFDIVEFKGFSKHITDILRVIDSSLNFSKYCYYAEYDIGNDLFNIKTKYHNPPVKLLEDVLYQLYPKTRDGHDIFREELQFRDKTTGETAIENILSETEVSNIVLRAKKSVKFLEYLARSENNFEKHRKVAEGLVTRINYLTKIIKEKDELNIGLAKRFDIVDKQLNQLSEIVQTNGNGEVVHEITGLKDNISSTTERILELDYTVNQNNANNLDFQNQTTVSLQQNGSKLDNSQDAFIQVMNTLKTQTKALQTIIPIISDIERNNPINIEPVVQVQAQTPFSIRNYGLSERQYECLKFISENQGLTRKELSDKSGIPKGTFNCLLRRSLKRFIKEKRIEGDRAKRIYIREDIL